MRKFKLFLVLFCFYFYQKKSISYNLPYLDLGVSNFLSGVPLREDRGWYFFQVYQYYGANKFLDGNGCSLRFKSNTKYEGNFGISALNYQSDCRILNGRIGCTFGVPYFFSSKISDSCLFLSSGKGFGDIFSDIYLQWDLIERNCKPFFQHNFGLLFSFPTGKWINCNKILPTINPGNNLFAFSPFWAYTFFIKPELTFSGYIYYIFSSKNRGTNIIPGQAVDLLYDLLYQFTNKFYFGFNGYFVQQLQNDKLCDIKIPKSKERVLGSGFGALYRPSVESYLVFHLYFESLVRNRSQGINFIFRWIQLF